MRSSTEQHAAPPASAVGRAVGALRSELRPRGERRLLLWLPGLFVLGLLLALVTPTAVEDDLLRAATADRPEGLVRVARVATTLGDLAVTAVLALVGVLLLRRWFGSVRLYVVVGLSFAGSMVLVGALKVVTARQRPDGGLVDTFSSSFPSGHAARAAAVYGLLVWMAHRVVRHTGARVVAVTAGVALAGAIALSRIYLGVHWPSDVLVGVVLGSLWLAVVVSSLRPHGGGGPGDG